MKTLQKLCTAIVLSIFSLSVHAQTDSITIKGHLKNMDNQTVGIVLRNEQGQTISAKTVANQGSFSLKMPKQDIPVVASLYTSLNRSLNAKVGENNYGAPAPNLDLFIYNKDLNINGDIWLLQFAEVNGDVENNALTAYRKLVNPYEVRNYIIYRDLFEAKYHEKQLKESEAQLEKELSVGSSKIRDIQKDFVRKNPDVLATVYLLSRMQNYYTAQDYQDIWNKVSEKYKNHPLATGIKSYLKKVSSTPAGSPAINFERKDKDGNLVNLANYKGRVVLLDFWGSWCGPCRASHPHLKELYKKYHSKGFEIIAVAHERGNTVEEAKKSWLNAIAEDGINWTHILNKDGIEKQDIVKDYNVMAFPTKILIDKEGKILLRISASATDDIDRALEKIYGF
ncbi:TlpA family protein disulfide reductase [Pedobacter montanisoli]|uniref:AhpC/TSA family protein n=1 Tax=Pedobacter montanisoli TaxID=2923277 RepID=A0ABS9ZR85_9SPHI|nr:TlpA disulfide reductase family protein [Pedobacter montanisoli]MCJ0741106.1 AhpC/TSA family protein [Pedobacter montanisoli]